MVTTVQSHVRHKGSLEIERVDWNIIKLWLHKVHIESQNKSAARLYPDANTWREREHLKRFYKKRYCVRIQTWRHYICHCFPLREVLIKLNHWRTTLLVWSWPSATREIVGFIVLLQACFTLRTTLPYVSLQLTITFEICDGDYNTRYGTRKYCQSALSSLKRPETW